jgi:hypothetical protein
LTVEVLRIIVSIAVERGWRLGSLDVKAAYLQAMGFNRELYVGPNKEGNEKTHAWRLENPPDSGILWFLTGFRAIQDHNLCSCP